MERNASLDRAVERLLDDARFLRRFRKDPDAALRPFQLSEREVEAVKRGDAEELVALGLDPRFVWPSLKATSGGRRWLARSGRKLAPLAFAVAAAALWPGSAQAVRTAPGQRRAARRIARAASRHRSGLPRAISRARTRTAPGLRAAARNAARTGTVGAVESVIKPPGGGTP